MPDASDPLYLFLHIPRTAGTSLTTTLRHALRGGRELHLSPLPGRRFLRRAEVDAYVDALPPQRRDRVRLVHGHCVYPGLHERFGRPGRYFTFLRDPVRRAISNYHYFRAHYELFLADNEDGTLPPRSEELDLERWWEVFPHDLQLGVLLNYLVADRPGWEHKAPLTEADLERGQRILDSFYFVGLTETFEEDSLFLYSLLGVERLLREPLNAQPGARIEVDAATCERLARDTRLDAALYRHGVEHNRRFKEQHPDFRRLGLGLQARARPLRPLRRRLFEAATRLVGLRRAVSLRLAVRRVLNPRRRRS